MEIAFGEKDWIKWRKRKVAEYRKNTVIVTVKEITNIAPAFKKTRDEWEPWKRRPCDAGFEPGQRMIFEEGKRLIGGEIFCFSAIASIIPWIWGMTYDAWFPWLHRKKSGYVIEEEGTFAEDRMTGICPDLENTVIFEIKRVRNK